jgi:hypothetical protein
LTPSAVELAPGGNREPDRVEYVFKVPIGFRGNTRPLVFDSHSFKRDCCKLDLKTAQREIASTWIEVYQKYVGSSGIGLALALFPSLLATFRGDTGEVTSAVFSRLSAPLRHALIALCLYCVTGDEPSPDILRRLFESNRKSIRIPLPQGTGDPLHAAFEIVQQLALQGHPMPLRLLLLRKSFLTLDGITRQLDPDFDAWLETLAYASGVLGSEAVVRTWSIPFPWLDRADFIPQFVQRHKNC